MAPIVFFDGFAQCVLRIDDKRVNAGKIGRVLLRLLEISLGKLGIRSVDDLHAFFFHAIAITPPRMVHFSISDVDGANLDGRAIEDIEALPCSHIFHRDWEIGLAHLVLEDGLEIGDRTVKIEAATGIDQRAWIRALTRSVASIQQAGYIPIILCPEEARILVKSSTEREIPELVVLSVPEIANDIKVEAIGEIKKE